MKFNQTGLEGVLSIKLDPFDDHRGQYLELYNKQIFSENGIGIKFIQDDISVSKKNVLRGIHGDGETWKLVSCLYGEFYLVVVNCDRESDHFGQWQSFTLSDKKRELILIPPKYGNGHVVLSDIAIFHYKQSTYYKPSGQFTYKWDDPELKIDWPVDEPVLSKRDQQGHW